MPNNSYQTGVENNRTQMNSSWPPDSTNNPNNSYSLGHEQAQHVNSNTARNYWDPLYREAELLQYIHTMNMENINLQFKIELSQRKIMWLERYLGIKKTTNLASEVGLPELKTPYVHASSSSTEMNKRKLKIRNHEMFIEALKDKSDEPEKHFEILVMDYNRYISNRLSGSKKDLLSRKIENVNKRVERAWKFLRIINYLRVCRSDSCYISHEKIFLNLILNCPNGLRYLVQDGIMDESFEDCLFTIPSTRFRRFEFGAVFLNERLKEIENSGAQNDDVKKMLKQLLEELNFLLKTLRDCQALLRMDENLSAEDRDFEAEDFFK